MGFPISVAALTEIDANDAHDADADVTARVASDAAPDRPRAVEHDVVAPVELGIGRWSRWVAVAAGFGYVPIAPGTAGSVAGVLLFLAALLAGAELSPAGFIAVYAIGIAILSLLGIWAAGRAEVDFGRRDDGRIVIDEVVGQLIALAPLAVFLAPRMAFGPGTPGVGGPDAPGAGALAGDSFAIFLEVVTAFVLFRLFDVWKPGAVRWAERRLRGGLGVMADDMVAGLHAAVGLFLIHALVFERLFSSASGALSVGFSVDFSIESEIGRMGIGILIGGLA